MQDTKHKAINRDCSGLTINSTSSSSDYCEIWKNKLFQQQEEHFKRPEILQRHKTIINPKTADKWTTGWRRSIVHRSVVVPLGYSLFSVQLQRHKINTLSRPVGHVHTTLISLASPSQPHRCIRLPLKDHHPLSAFCSFFVYFCAPVYFYYTAPSRGFTKPLTTDHTNFKLIWDELSLTSKVDEIRRHQEITKSCSYIFLQDYTGNE